MRVSGAKGLPLRIPILAARAAQFRIDEVHRLLGYNVGEFLT